MLFSQLELTTLWVSATDLVKGHTWDFLQISDDYFICLPLTRLNPIRVKLHPWSKCNLHSVQSRQIFCLVWKGLPTEVELDNKTLNRKVFIDGLCYFGNNKNPLSLRGFPLSQRRNIPPCHAKIESDKLFVSHRVDDSIPMKTFSLSLASGMVWSFRVNTDLHTVDHIPPENKI